VNNPSYAGDGDGRIAGRGQPEQKIHENLSQKQWVHAYNVSCGVGRHGKTSVQRQHGKCPRSYLKNKEKRGWGMIQW
jgi:hypothetical protein